MRVVAGMFGGRRLQAPPGMGTRPTPDRVREALFSSLGPLDGVAVADPFAGSGALGIEALSRGAASCVFGERDRDALRVLRANLATLGLGPPDALVEPRGWRRALETAAPAGLVLLDPPFDDLPDVLPRLAAALSGVVAPGGRLVVESPSRGPEPDVSPLRVARRRDRTYGSVRITIVELDPEPSSS
ncbi:MAG: RsmD family RNA methyltransferase [Thermoleophilia bacterium]|nr:RsmD family RNA methyltransferase [Thermoleophilia bacterium]